jgi:hypothetical protein
MININININKKYILFLTLATISSSTQTTTLTIPHAKFANQEASLFLLVETNTHFSEDQPENQQRFKFGFFELNNTKPTYKIAPEEFYDVKKATFDRDGTEVAFSNFNESDLRDNSAIYFEVDAEFAHESDLEDNSVICFEIDPEFTVVRALIISNSILNEIVFQLDSDSEISNTEDNNDASIDDPFGDDLEGQRAAIIANQGVRSKHFTTAEIYAGLKIVALVKIDQAQRFCSALNKRAKRCARWLAGYKS